MEQVKSDGLLLKEVVMLSFYDCDKNLSEIDFNDIEKKLEVSFQLHLSHIISNGMEVIPTFLVFSMIISIMTILKFATSFQ